MKLNTFTVNSRGWSGGKTIENKGGCVRFIDVFSSETKLADDKRRREIELYHAHHRVDDSVCGEFFSRRKRHVFADVESRGHAVVADLPVHGDSTIDLTELFSLVVNESTVGVGRILRTGKLKIFLRTKTHESINFKSRDEKIF